MQRRSRSALLLTELVISIFFFLAAAAVSVQIYAAAERMSAEAAKNRNLAELVRSCGESFSAAEGDPDQTLQGLSAVYHSLIQKDGEGILLLSDSLTEDPQGKTSLTLTFSEDERGAGCLCRCRLLITKDDGTEAYSRVLEAYRAREGS